jgi:sulfite reductase alpha subunit-like flavoprotein
VTLSDLLLKYIDLSGRVPGKLAQLAGVESPAASSVGEFLVKEFNGTITNITQFLAVLPRIESRTYSIASEKADVVELIIGDVNLTDGRLGLTTGYLARESTNEIAVSFIEGEFHYPADPATPLILIGLGTGIAPIVSILEHRKAGGFGKGIVIFGLRVRQAAAGLLEELNALKEAGVYDELWLAVSHAEDRLHVADVINNNKAKVWELWSIPTTELFYCGAPTGYDSVRDALVGLTIEFGKKQKTQAATFTSKHTITVEAY